jgi:DNA modification methylase
MQKIMSGIVAEYGLSDISAETLARTSAINRKIVKGKTFEVVNNDCVAETRAMEDNSVDLILTSIPFGNQYSYCSNYHYFGYTESNNQFWGQMDFLSPHLLRVLKPGRIACVHVKDRILIGQYEGTGCPTVDPFHADAIYHYRRHGFFFMGMITVVTDVVRENNQTYRLGWTEQCKDGTKMGVGMPEYVLIFRKPQTDLSRGYADDPVIKDKSSYSRARWQIDAHGFWRDSGDRLMTAEELNSLDLKGIIGKFNEYSKTHVYDYEEHVAIGDALEEKGKLPKLFMAIAPASPHPDVWADIPRVLTLNTRQKQKGLRAHCCPLQIKLVERLITRYSNEGDAVYDPFGGIMTVPYCAIKMNRRGIACELNEEYFRDGLRYLEQAERDKRTRALFDEIEVA